MNVFNIIHYNVNLDKISFFVTVKLTEYIFSPVKVCSNPCVDSFSRTNIYIFFIINMSRGTHIYSKNYYILTTSTTWK